jgi:hypothetical protein
MTFLLADGSHQETHFFNIGQGTSLPTNNLHTASLIGTDLYIFGETSNFHIYQTDLSWNTAFMTKVDMTFTQDYACVFRETTTDFDSKVSAGLAVAVTELTSNVYTTQTVTGTYSGAITPGSSGVWTTIADEGLTAYDWQLCPYIWETALAEDV